jgi:S1-C subfamily serine protease
MRKSVGYLVVFVVGLGLGLALLKTLGAFSHAGEDRARQNVLALLDKAAPSAGIADTPLVRAAAKIEPAVVNIDTLGTRREVATDPFGEEFQTSQQFQGKGSGVIISADGYVVTNNHVIENASVIRITTANDKHYDGRIIGADPDADLAVVKIDAVNIPSAELGDSNSLKVGESVIAIGNPLGVGTTVTHGIISATNRRNLPVSEGRVLSQALQTDAPINRGNSGGALANMNGQLIGINTAIASADRGGGNIGIGFAIPINAARDILKNLIARGRSLPAQAPGVPFLGIRLAPLPGEYAPQFNLQPGQGVVVESVEPLTAASDAGLKRGDVISEIDGKPILKRDDVRQVLVKRKVGEHVTLKMVRGDGTRQDVKVALGRRPTPMQ